jgi:hypothetical protein
MKTRLRTNARAEEATGRRAKESRNENFNCVKEEMVIDWKRKEKKKLLA